MFLTGAYQEVRRYTGLTLLSRVLKLKCTQVQLVQPYAFQPATLGRGCQYTVLLAALPVDISDGKLALLAGHGVGPQHARHPQCGHCALQQLLQQQRVW